MGRTTRQRAATSARQGGGVQEILVLPHDVLLRILRHAAWPLSAWVPKEEEQHV